MTEQIRVHQLKREVAGWDKGDWFAQKGAKGAYGKTRKEAIEKVKEA